MAYDAARGKVVLFGGQSAQRQPDNTLPALDDTWTWDGTTWTRQHPAASPPPTVGSVLAYHAPTGATVLVGSYWEGTAGPLATRTWRWDGTNWTELHPSRSPSAPRIGAAMAYHESTGRLVLFGAGAAPDPNPLDGVTWLFDGMNWTRHAVGPADPPARSGAALAPDRSGNLLLIGGVDGITGTFYNVTWTWDGAGWRRRDPAIFPSPRAEAAMAYDAARGTTILYGGETISQTSGEQYDDTWTWDGTTWMPVGKA
jgi:hypothetical protein